MSNPLMDLLSAVGYVADTPGALLRGVISGRPGDRVGGRELLEQLGLIDPNTDGLDAGDVAGFGADMLLDPLNLIGAGWLGKTAKAAGAVDKANDASHAMRAAGFMPEETIAKLHPSMLESPGVPKKMYHGTPASGVDATNLTPDMAGARTDPGYYGKGVSFTTDRKQANMYSSNPRTGDDGAVISAFLDVQNPFIGSGPRPYGKPSPWGDGPRPSFLDDVRNAGIQAPDKAHVAKMTPEESQALTDALRAAGHDASFPDPIPELANDFSDRMAGAELTVFDKSQIHLPYIAPALQNRPSTRNPLIAMMIQNMTARSQSL